MAPPAGDPGPPEDGRCSRAGGGAQGFHAGGLWGQNAGDSRGPGVRHHWRRPDGVPLRAAGTRAYFSKAFQPGAPCAESGGPGRAGDDLRRRCDRVVPVSPRSPVAGGGGNGRLLPGIGAGCQRPRPGPRLRRLRRAGQKGVRTPDRAAAGRLPPCGTPGKPARGLYLRRGPHRPGPGAGLGENRFPLSCV